MIAPIWVGSTPAPAYAVRTDYRPGDSIPLALDGRPVAQLPVGDLLG